MGLFGSGLGLPQLFGGLVQQGRPEEAEYGAYQQNPLQGIGDLGTRLMAAQAAIDGDFGGAARLNASVGAEDRAARAALAKSMADRNEWVWRQQYQAANQQPDEDVFTKTLRAAGIDPASPQGRELYRQRALTQALPAPSLIGTPQDGYQWVQPPSPTLGGAPMAQPTATVPTVSDAASYEALPPGTQYRDPNGQLRTKGGGVGNGAGGFPANRIPSGNPLQRPW